MREERVRILTDFVQANLLADRSRRVTPYTRLLRDGMVDSMGLVLLAAFVEERFNVRLEDADLRNGGAETIADIAALIDARG
ncbi:MAG TPA: acyl carrier protein [Candidatus Binatus sp.]|nr:acyl carrier protein [Candidatus Binatus sp.]